MKEIVNPIATVVVDSAATAVATVVINPIATMVVETTIINPIATMVETTINPLYDKVEKEIEEAINLKKSIVDLWVEYNKAKELAKNSIGEEKIKYTIEKLKWSIALNRKDIAVWQYNNIAYEYIKMFEKNRDKALLETAKVFIDKAIELNKNLNESLSRTKILLNNKKYIEENLNVNN
jgi:hypothetical protein